MRGQSATALPSKALACLRGGIALTVFCGGVALAEPRDSLPAEARAAQMLLSIPAPVVPGAFGFTGWQPSSSSRRPQLIIVEVPSDLPLAVAGRQAQIALSIQTDTPQRMLRAAGLEAADCATRLRLPTRMRRDEITGSRSLDIGAHVGFNCRF